MLLIHESHVLPVTRGGQEHWPVETEQLSVGLGQLQALGREGGGERREGEGGGGEGEGEREKVGREEREGGKE